MTYSYVNLVAARKTSDDLAVFAQAFFAALSVVDYEERESSNYACGSYFSGRQDAREISIMESGDIQDEEMPFWVEITSSEKEQIVVAAVERQIQSHLLPAGFVVTRIQNPGKPNEERVQYGRD